MTVLIVALLLVGGALVTAGAYLVYPPAALLAPGFGLLIAALYVDDGKTE